MRLAGLIAALAIVPHAASACPNVAAKSKWRNAPIIVSGTAVCAVAEGRCTITVKRVLRGGALLGKITGPVLVRIPIPTEDYVYCGVDWSPYEDRTQQGYFFLARRPGIGITGAFWPEPYR